VGVAYPCWYDPDLPEKVILVRGHHWDAYVFLIMPLAMLMIGGVGMWMARAIVSNRPAPVASGGDPTQAPAVPRPIQWLQSVVTAPNAFDPSRLGDPVAMKTEWHSTQGRGANFQTRKLVEVDGDRLEFRATKSAYVFALAFLLPGLLVIFLMLKDAVAGLARGHFNVNMLVALPVGLLFPAVGGYLLYSWTTPIVFDRRAGLFWQGRTEPSEGANGSLPENVVSLKEVHALQLMRTSSTQHRSFELNLVMSDGERRHVTVYGSNGRNRLREDAAVIGEFLRKPVWDAM
jgi:hypothetical protein